LQDLLSVRVPVAGNDAGQSGAQSNGLPLFRTLPASQTMVHAAVPEGGEIARTIRTPLVSVMAYWYHTNSLSVIPSVSWAPACHAEKPWCSERRVVSKPQHCSRLFGALQDQKMCASLDWVRERGRWSRRAAGPLLYWPSCLLLRTCSLASKMASSRD